MAWNDLPTNYKDAAWTGSRKFNMTQNQDGTVSFEDVTDYTQIENAYRSADDVNATNEAINTIMSTFEGSYKLLEPTNVTIANGNQKALITWTDPNNGIRQDNTTSVQWAGTLVVRKENIPPFGHDDIDAVTIVDEKMRNQYSSEPFTDTGLINGRTYFYGIYPYTSEGKFTDSYVAKFTPSANISKTCTINVTTIADATVTAVGTAETVTGTADSNGLCTLTTHYVDTYTVSANTSNWYSIEESITIRSNTSTYIVTLTQGASFSWNKIKQDLNNGDIDNYNVGDTFDVPIRGDQTYTFVIVAKNHDADNQLIFGLQSETGLGTKRVINSWDKYNNNVTEEDKVKLSIENMDIFSWLNNSFYYSMPKSLQNVISTRFYEVAYGYSGNISLKTISSKVWLPRAYEIRGTGGPLVEQNAPNINQFEYYRNLEYDVYPKSGSEIPTSLSFKHFSYNSGEYDELYIYRYYTSFSSNKRYWGSENTYTATSTFSIYPFFEIRAD